MAHFALLWKARAAEKYRSNYEEEKIKSISLARVEAPRKRLSEKWRSYRLATNETVSRTFSIWFPNGSTVYRCLLYLRSGETFATFLLKSVLGFAGGIVLTYLCFMFFVFQLSISLMLATIISSIIGVLLTLGLAFSYRIRCLVFLLIPQLFSRVGRYTLTCYALVLILTGPATNTLKNSEVLSESMACSQEQIKTSVRQINESHKIRYSSIKDNLKIMMERFEEISKLLTNVIMKINRLVLSIVSSVQASFNWLKWIANNCNHKIGTPYNYCKQHLNEGVKDCKDVLGPEYSWLCDPNNVAEATCGDLTKYKSFCGVSEFIDDSIPATVRKKLKTFSDRIASLLYMELHIHYSYSFSSNASRSASQVAAGIVTEIRKRADPLLTWLSWSSCVTSLFLLLIIFRAKYYQQMYDTRSRFDNRYITQELRDLDLKRLREGRETILPLNRRERAKYVTTTSFRLVPSEKVHLNRSAVFMMITTFKLLIHIVADYSLYWILMTIQYYGRSQTPVEDELPNIYINISGTSFAARLVKSLISTLKMPLSSLSDTSSTSCLPDPYPPDLRRYMQIGALIFLLWFFALFEPYGLRLRHVIMGRYRPERAKARATWLYNHILKTRGGFMKSARKKLHREYKYSSEAHLTFKKWITTHIPFKILRFLFGICAEDKICFLCGTKEYPNDIDTELIRCKSKTCQGIYCCRCFSDIGQLCTICLSPKDYGDLSDVSLEKGSSEDSSDSDNDNNDFPSSGSKSSRRNINYHENDMYYLKQDTKEKKDRNLFTKNDQREDEIPLLPYTSYKTSRMAILSDYTAKGANGNTTLFKLKETLRDNLQKHVQHYNFWYTNRQKIGDFLKYTLHDYESLLNDVAITTITNFKILMEYFIHYSFYEIEKLNNTLLIKRVRQPTVVANAIRRQYKSIVRRKEQRNSKSSHNNMASHNLTKRQDVYKDRSNENIFNTSNNRKKQRSKKNKNGDKIKKQIHAHKQDKSTTSCFGKCNMSCFKCWKQIKLDLLSCTDLVDKSKTILQASKEMKNYKRRKKRNKDDLRNSNSLERYKMDIDDTRKFRMFAYFSDQEWMRKKSSNDKSYNTKFQFDNELYFNALEGIKTETTSSKVKEDTSIFAMKSNARTLNSLQTKYKPSTHIRRSLRPKNYPPSEYQKYVDRINFLSKELKRKAIVRFRDTIGVKPQSAAEKVADNLTFDQNYQIKENFIAISPQPSTSFSRRINFYRSLGATEFDDMYDVVNANERIDLKLNTRSSSRSGKENGLSIAFRKNANTARDKKYEILKDKACETAPIAKSPLKRHKSSVTSEILNKKWLHIKLKNPFSMMKEFLSTATEGSSKIMWGKSNIRHVKVGTQNITVKTASKGVYVIPVTKSCSCQCIPQGDTKEMTTQTCEESSEENPLEPIVVCHSTDVEIEMCHKNNHKMTQRTIVQRDMGTRVNHLQQEHREYNDNVKINNSTGSSDASFTISDAPSVFSLRSDGTNKTDITVLSLPTIHCKEERRVRGKKFKVQVVTKTNQSTSTAKANVCDVSTVTEDWWSPILDRKKLKNSPTIQRKQILLEKKGGFMMQNEKTRKRLKNRGMMTDGKIVTFKSRTQIIPAEIADILSPSRYLLESQKYYNELFLSKYYGRRTVPVFQFQKQKAIDKEKSPNFNRPQTRKRHKAKRLEENYSSRKQFSPRKRAIDSKIVETPRARHQTSKQENKMNRNSAETNYKKKQQDNTGK